MKVAEIAFVAYPVTDIERVGLEVEEFDLALAQLKARSILFDVEAMESPVCRMALIADPDGNKITIHKRHP